MLLFIMTLRLVTSKITKSGWMGSSSCIFMCTDTVMTQITSNSMSNWKNSSYWLCQTHSAAAPCYSQWAEEVWVTAQGCRSAQHFCTFRHWLQGVPVFKCDAEKRRALQKFYILVSICTCVFRDPNSQLFAASDTKWMHGKFDFCAFSRTVFLDFTRIIEFNIFSMWFADS